MAEQNADFLRRLQATFQIEAQEHLQTISSGLLALEKTPAASAQRELIETVFREAHSLKGAARAVNMTEIEVICQSLESLCAAWRRQELSPSPALFDVLREVVNSLEAFLVSAGRERTLAEKSWVRTLLDRVESVVQGGPLPSEQAEWEAEEKDHPPVPTLAPVLPVTGEKSVLGETVRIPTVKLDSLLLQAEELIAAKLLASERVTGLRELNATLAVWKKEWTKSRPHLHALQRLLESTGQRNGHAHFRDGVEAQVTQLLEFLQWNESHRKTLESTLATLAKAAEEDQRTLGRMVDNLLGDMKKVLMLPFSSLLEVFPKLVRDLSHDRSKKVELVIRGGEIEADRRILEEMKNPLIHLVRNCIDHGIEAPTERARKQKPPSGTITIALAPQDGNKVEILIADDGAGIDVATVRSTVQKLGLLSPEEVEQLSEQGTVSLIFQSGVSTSPMITDLSGRGLGLAIVREKVEKLGGIVSVATQRDAGTTFRLILPLTLATFRGVLVRVSAHRFVLPTTYVERVVRVNKADIKTVENQETIQLNGRAVSLVRLDNVLGLSQQNVPGNGTDRVPVVVLAAAEKRIAFLVDEVLYEQEVLMKSLGPQLSRVRNIAGATILGAGAVVPILNVPDLMKSAVRMSTAVGQRTAAPGEEAAEKQSILVVEDSITARTLIQNILEAAGYDVVTAVDGIDGFTKLRSGTFALVVSDVDMPRMNGFDLTAKIRGDQKLAEVPVVLVTALESREDRERGIEVGANAYIVKRSFDQSNLLEVVRRLI